MRERAPGRILDIGCGSGVMSSFLTRFGDVTGIDFSAPAIAIASRMIPTGSFRVATVDEIDPAWPFDVVTLFDVIEHIPQDDRSGFLARAFDLVAPGGLAFLSSPHPFHTRWLRAEHPELLQIVDEVVEPADVMAAASEHGLEPVQYCTFSISEPRQYQAFAFIRPGASDATPSLAPGARRRLRWLGNPLTRPLRREVIARTAARRGDRALAREIRRQR
ncbi:MAG: methyltransferase domain-containing protein [Actinobacteria bacterium]|nr:methyltransferase domain-containing protein [Actinomycetota bacterium]